MFNNFLYFATVLRATRKSFSFNFSTKSESEIGFFLSSTSIKLLMIFLSSFDEATSPDFLIKAFENKLFKLINPRGESINLFLIILLTLEISFSILIAISSNLSGFKNS